MAKSTKSSVNPNAPPEFQISYASHGKHMPAATLHKPYTARLICDAEGAEFVEALLPGGFKITKDGVITGTPMDIGPHRFEVCAVHKEHGKTWFSSAISAAVPPKRGAAAPVSGVPMEQVELMIKQAVENALAAQAAAAPEPAPAPSGITLEQAQQMIAAALAQQAPDAPGKGGKAKTPPAGEGGGDGAAAA